MTISSICAVLSDTRTGTLALTVAGNLVRRLNVQSLLIHLRDDAKQVALVGSSESRLLVSDTQRQRVLQRVMTITGLPADRITLAMLEHGSEPAFPPDTLVVDQSMAGKKVPAWVLVPFEEERFGSGGEGPILLPFGNDDTGPRSAMIAISLAKSLGCEIVFYHTTWRDTDKTSASPEEHMCAAAVEVRKELEALAADNNVPFTTIVETADDVVRGILRVAMEKGASLIVSRRGRKVEIGSYVTQLCEQSPVPLLIRR